MSLAAKLYNRIVLNRIRTPIDEIMRKYQAGFRNGLSCIQQINILRRIMDGIYSHVYSNIPLLITFFDFKKAFDSTDRTMMMVCHLTTLWHTWQNCLCCMAARHGYLRRHLPKLDIFTRTCYRIMMGIKQSRDHVTNERLYQRVNQVQIREMIRVRKLRFTSDCILMPTDESINCFVLNESIVRPSFRPGAQTRTYRLKISYDLLRDENTLDATWKYGNFGEKICVRQTFIGSKTKNPPNPSSELEWWWW